MVASFGICNVSRLILMNLGSRIVSPSTNLRREQMNGGQVKLYDDDMFRQPLFTPDT